MKHIGGFFELEPEGVGRSEIHNSAYAMHTGRACLMVILSSLAPRRVFVPNYTCDATLDPFREQQVETVFYAVDDNFLPIGLPALQKGECILYTNYFGLCEKLVEQLAGRFGTQLLVDDTHAFFRGRRKGLWSFTSARKYFGVPDGAYLYAPVSLPGKPPPVFEEISLRHLQLRMEGQQAEAFAAFQQYERSLDTRVFGISAFSRQRLSHVDYPAVAEARRQNYKYLERALASTNRLNLDLAESVPFCYPYLPHIPIPHQQLYKQQVYPPKLWTDVLNRCASAWEKELVETLLPLPVDHRYGDDAMQTILNGLGVS